MRLSLNFSLREFTKSQTASRLGISNKPEGDHQTNLQALVTNVLQPIRSELGRPMTINSGYRSPELNEAIGGSKKSQHCKGEAADIEVIGMDNLALAQYIRDNLEFDQLIFEFYEVGDPQSGWIHVSYKADGSNRNRVMSATRRADGKVEYTPGIRVA